MPLWQSQNILRKIYSVIKTFPSYNSVTWDTLFCSWNLATSACHFFPFLGPFSDSEPRVLEWLKGPQPSLPPPENWEFSFEIAAKAKFEKQGSPDEDVDSARSDLGGAPAPPAVVVKRPSLSGGWLALLRLSSNFFVLWNTM